MAKKQVAAAAVDQAAGAPVSIEAVARRELNEMLEQVGQGRLPMPRRLIAVLLLVDDPKVGIAEAVDMLNGACGPAKAKDRERVFGQGVDLADAEARLAGTKAAIGTFAHTKKLLDQLAKRTEDQFYRHAHLAAARRVSALKCQQTVGGPDAAASAPGTLN